MTTETLPVPIVREQNAPPSGLLLDAAQQFLGKGMRASFVERQEIYQDPELAHVQDVLLLDSPNQDMGEPTVRLYRGIRPRQSTEILEQRAYLLKKPNHTTGQSMIESEEAHSAAEFFLGSGRFKDLVSAVEAADMSESDRKFVDEHRLKDIAQSLIRYPDRPLRQELAFQHVASPGGQATQDISPFVATSIDPDKAMRYGSSFLVVDVPVSAIEGRGESDEVLVGLQLKPEWIKAVATIKHDPHGIPDGEGVALAKHLGMTDEQAIQQRDVVDAVLSRYAEKDESLLPENILDAQEYLTERICKLCGDDADAVRQRLKDADIHDYRLAARQAWQYISEQQASVSHLRSSLPEGEVPDERQLKDMYEMLQYFREKARAVA